MGKVIQLNPNFTIQLSHENIEMFYTATLLNYTKFNITASNPSSLIPLHQLQPVYSQLHIYIIISDWTNHLCKLSPDWSISVLHCTSNQAMWFVQWKHCSTKISWPRARCKILGADKRAKSPSDNTSEEMLINTALEMKLTDKWLAHSKLTFIINVSLKLKNEQLKLIVH